MRGVTCRPCLSHISGSNKRMITDGDTNTCEIIPQTTAGAIPLYVFGIHGNCISESTATLKVTIETAESCNDLISLIVKSNSGCNGFNNHFNVWNVMNTSVVNGGNVCELKCKCADDRYRVPKYSLIQC